MEKEGGDDGEHDRGGERERPKERWPGESVIAAEGRVMEGGVCLGGVSLSPPPGLSVKME